MYQDKHSRAACPVVARSVTTTIILAYSHRNNAALIAHEQCHQKQMAR